MNTIFNGNMTHGLDLHKVSQKAPSICTPKNKTASLLALMSYVTCGTWGPFPTWAVPLKGAQQM